MRSVLLRSLTVIAIGGIVLAGVLYVASTVDARPPTVLEMRLTQAVGEDSQLALITTSLEVVFSEPIDPDSAADAIQVEPAVDGAVSWSGSTMIFTPADPLELDTSYVVTIEPGIRDTAGNEMAEVPPPFEFTTSGPPGLAETTPADGAQEVPLDAPIALTFSTLMDTASVESALRLRPTFPHDLRWSGELLQLVPTAPLRAGQEYEIAIGGEATDVAGVPLGQTVRLTFRTVETGLVVVKPTPTDGIEGVAPTAPIAVIFDRSIDPGSVDEDAWTITPDLAGTLEVTTPEGDPASDEVPGTVLRFTPASPMPSNTTFTVELAQGGVASTAGGGLAAPLRWSFTTGAPQAAISNQVTYITERSGTANVWAMNPDGTGKRQLSSELTPVIDYAVAPDGSSLVVADGRRLVYLRADGTERRVLTPPDTIEFDPTYSPDGQRIAFARADAATGAGLGLWEWPVEGGDPSRIELPPTIDATPTPSASSRESAPLRAPRYSPDGQALAFVDMSGWVDLLELPASRLTRVQFTATASPVWMPDSSEVLVTGSRRTVEVEPPIFEAPVEPLEPRASDATVRLSRSATAVTATTLGSGTRILAVSADRVVAYTDVNGALWVATDFPRLPDEPALSGERVLGAAFEPGDERGLIIVLETTGRRGTIESFDVVTRRHAELAPSGSAPRWLP